MGPARGAARADSLPLRLLSAFIGLPLVVGAVWVGGPVLLGFGTVVALAALMEFRALTSRVGTLSVTVAGAGAVGFMVAAWRGEPLASLVVAAVVAGGLLWHLGRSLVTPDTGSGLTGWAMTVTGALYPSALLSFGLAIHGLEYSVLDQGIQGARTLTIPDYGRDSLLLFVLVTFASDTGAYFTGRVIGRHKMAPRISPGKTWEGVIGGILAAVVASFVLALELGVPVPLRLQDPNVPAGGLAYREVVLLGLHLPATLVTTIAIGIGASLLAQAGDLAESLLKRASGVKEAGWLVPGHGGILDRLDSVVLVLPAAYYGLVWAGARVV